MADVLDVLYRMRNMASEQAEILRAQIADAQVVLDKLDDFANDAQDTAQLAAASDLFPTYSANIPRGTGLVRPEPTEAAS